MHAPLAPPLSGNELASRDCGFSSIFAIFLSVCFGESRTLSRNVGSGLKAAIRTDQPVGDSRANVWSSKSPLRMEIRSVLRDQKGEFGTICKIEFTVNPVQANSHTSFRQVQLLRNLPVAPTFRHQSGQFQLSRRQTAEAKGGCPSVICFNGHRQPYGR